ncbi:MAG: small, acid-soluble spore protein, alpha/beta type [Eubacteriales bacterium]
MSEKKLVNYDELDETERMKYEIAEELGLLDRVMENGWKMLTAKETGRIGGLVTKKKREMHKKGNSEQCTKGFQ